MTQAGGFLGGWLQGVHYKGQKRSLPTEGFIQVSITMEPRSLFRGGGGAVLSFKLQFRGARLRMSMSL